MNSSNALTVVIDLGNYTHKDVTKAVDELRRLHSLNQELVDTLKYIEAQRHLGHIHYTASAALAKARGKA